MRPANKNTTDLVFVGFAAHPSGELLHIAPAQRALQAGLQLCDVHGPIFVGVKSVEGSVRASPALNLPRCL